MALASFRRAPGGIVDLLAIWILSAPSWLPLLQGRLVGTHDGYFHLYRLVELDRAIRAGNLYPRWAPDFALGYGYPVFDYYPPLMLYLAMPWRLLGVGPIASLGLAQFVALLAAGAAMYLLARDLFGRAAGVVAGLLYATLPYLLVDVYVRGAIAETLALAMLPLVAWALRRAAMTPSPRRLALAALTVGALTLAHNITTLLALPVLIAFAVLPLVPASSRPDSTGARGRLSLGPKASSSPGTGARDLARAVGGLGASLTLGIAVAAIYWLPALLERDLVHNELLTTLFYDFHNHFQPLRELVQRTLAFEYRYDAFAGFLFKPGLVQLVVAALAGLVGLARLRARRVDLVFLAIIAVVGLFLLTSRSAFLWETMPLLGFVQFPWRALSLVGFATVLLGASAVAATAHPRRRATVAVAVLLPWALASFADLRPALLDLRDEDVSRGALNRIELDRRLIGTTTIGEYVPRTVLRGTFEGWHDAFPDTASPIQALAAEPTDNGGLRLAVAAPADGTLMLDQYYFPGWAATVDGRPAAVRPTGDRGLLTVDVPAGGRDVSIWLGTTPVRTLGAALSAGAAIGAIALLAIGRRAGVAVAASLAILCVGASAWPSPPAEARGSALESSRPIATFEGGPRLLGLHGDGPGEATLYWSTDAPVARQLEVALRLLDADGRVVARRDKPPRYGFRPTDAWRPGAVVRDLADLALVGAGDDVGKPYRLVAGLHDRQGYLTPAGGEVVHWRESCPCAAPGPEGVGVLVGQMALPPPAPTPAPFLGTGRDLSLPGPTIADGRIELLSVQIDAPRPVPTLLDRVANRLAARLPVVRRALPAVPSPGGALGGPGGALATLDPGATLAVAPRWRSLADVPEDYAIFVHLLDHQQRLVTQDDEWPRRGFSPTSLWHSGQETPDGYRLRIPPDTPPGGYTLALGLYRRADFSRLRWSGEPAGRDQVVLGRVKVRPLPEESVTPPSGATATFGGAVQLLGFDGLPLDGASLRPGATLAVRPRWRVVAPVERDLTVFVHLLDERGQLAANGDGPPLGGGYPTSLWDPGEEIADAYQIVVPAGLRGPAAVEIGLYRLDTGERLRTDKGADSLVVARLSIASP